MKSGRIYLLQKKDKRKVRSAPYHNREERDEIIEGWKKIYKKRFYIQIKPEIEPDPKILSQPTVSGYEKKKNNFRNIDKPEPKIIRPEAKYTNLPSPLIIYRKE